MFGFFGSEVFGDSQLGELRRSRGMWRGTITMGSAVVPLALSGSRAAPDTNAILLARAVGAELPSWRPAIERALFEHYSPYAESVAAGDEEEPSAGLPAIDAPAGVWSHTAVEFVQVSPLGGDLAVEIGYRVAWDEEHTLGARLRDGRLIELCGSVLAP